MKITVLDDEAEERALLVRFIEQYLYINHDDLYRVVDFANPKELLDDFAKEPARIAFVDIYLEGLPIGIEVARTLHRLAPDCLLIFVTSSPDFAVEGFELQAVHYCLKPVRLETVNECFARCKERGEWADNSIVLPQGMDTIQVPLRMICYIDSFGHTVRIWLREQPQPIEVRSSLALIAEQLSDCRFLRTSRSYIVNMDYVESLEQEVFVMEGGVQIPISRQERSGLRKAYNHYIIERTRKGG